MNDTHIRFWPYFKSRPVPLCGFLEQRSTDGLSEDSPYLLVEVKVRWDERTLNYHFCALENLLLNISVAFDIDHHTMHSSTDQDSASAVEDALVLIEWHDSQKTKKKGLVIYFNGLKMTVLKNGQSCLILDESMILKRSSVSQDFEGLSFCRSG